MNYFLSLVISLLTVLTVQAHEYHFAFAEAEYNPKTHTVQATVIVSTHDFEHTLFEEGMDVGHLETYTGNKLMEISIADEILKHFTVTLGEVKCAFHLLGMEVLHSGMTHFYFESEPLTYAPSIHILFDLMMDRNPEQQNKLTWITDTRKISVPFLYNERKQSITID